MDSTTLSIYFGQKYTFLSLVLFDVIFESWARKIPITFYQWHWQIFTKRSFSFPFNSIPHFIPVIFLFFVPDYNQRVFFYLLTCIFIRDMTCDKIFYWQEIFWHRPWSEITFLGCVKRWSGTSREIPTKTNISYKLHLHCIKLK